MEYYMKLFKLIALSFVLAFGMLVPANITFASSCDHDESSIGITHSDHDDDHGGKDDDDDDDCSSTTVAPTTIVDTTLPPTTVVDTTVAETTVAPSTTVDIGTPPRPLPETGSGTTIAVIAGILVIGGGALLYMRKKR
jgi:LPXTG-motif cell wall-anchored protein